MVPNDIEYEQAFDSADRKSLSGGFHQPLVLYRVAALKRVDFLCSNNITVFNVGSETGSRLRVEAGENKGVSYPFLYRLF